MYDCVVFVRLSLLLDRLQCMKPGKISMVYRINYDFRGDKDAHCFRDTATRPNVSVRAFIARVTGIRRWGAIYHWYVFFNMKAVVM
jgi:hypothetical protein